mgnify:CR=1 FL=1
MILQKNSPPPAVPKKKRRIWPYVAIVFLFFVAAAAGALFASTSLLDKEDPKAEEEHLLTAKDKSTIMIMGVDQREDDVGRSDTLMVTMIDPKKNKAALLSVPRDTRVKIKGHGYDKINAAYAYGGEKLTQRTVEDFLGIRMDHYVIINTHAFQKIIDAIGGIDIDVEKRMYYEDPWDDDGGLVIDLRPGRQHMDGKTAVTYVRYRDEEGDIGRVKRQQKFMRACVDAVTTPAILPRLPGIIASVIDSVKTDLSVRQMLEFIGTLKQAQAKGLRTDMVPGRPLYIEGISYWIPDMEQLRRNMVNTLGLSLNANERSRMERAIRDYENSIPAGATEVPEGDNTIGRRVSGDEALDTRSRKHSSSEDSSKTERKSTDQKSSDKSSKTQSADTSPPKKSADTDSGSGSGSNSRHASTRQSSSADSDSGGGDTAAPQRSGGSPGKEN